MRKRTKSEIALKEYINAGLDTEIRRSIYLKIANAESLTEEETNALVNTDYDRALLICEWFAENRNNKTVGADLMNAAIRCLGGSYMWEIFNFICCNCNPTTKAISEGLNQAYTLGHYNKEEALEWLQYTDKKYLMDKKEQRVYDSLPEEVTIYRGTSLEEAENGEYGLSWSYDIEEAKMFAYEYWKYKGQRGRCVLQANVKKEDIAAVFEGRNEKEIITAAAKNVRIYSSN